MRSLVAASVLVAGCASLPPLRPADPTQAVANERSSATAVADGVRVVVRPGAWKGWRGDLEDRLTVLEVRIHNGSRRGVQVRPESFTLVTPQGFRYEALSREEVRLALGPYRGSGYGWTYYGFGVHPWGLDPWGPYPWGGPWAGWSGWGWAPSPWWGGYPYAGAYPHAASPVPAGALARGTIEAGGSGSVLVFFPVPETSLGALTLVAELVDASGDRIGAVRVPFAREGERPVAVPLAPTATPEAGDVPRPGVPDGEAAGPPAPPPPGQ